MIQTEQRSSEKNYFTLKVTASMNQTEIERMQPGLKQIDMIEEGLENYFGCPEIRYLLLEIGFIEQSITITYLNYVAID